MIELPLEGLCNKPMHTWTQEEMLRWVTTLHSQRLWKAQQAIADEPKTKTKKKRKVTPLEEMFAEC